MARGYVIYRNASFKARNMSMIAPHCSKLHSSTHCQQFCDPRAGLRSNAHFTNYFRFFVWICDSLSFLLIWANEHFKMYFFGLYLIIRFDFMRCPMLFVMMVCGKCLISHTQICCPRITVFCAGESWITRAQWTYQ